jgi:CRP-like cAMP-binding protein
MNKLEVLKKSELFRDLDSEQLSVVEKMCTPMVFEPGAILCKQAKKEENIYVIEEGLVGIFLELGPLTQRQVQAASNFDVVGWSAVIEPRIATATAKAIEKTKVLAFNGQALYELSSTNPAIGSRVSWGVTRIVATRLHNAFSQLLGVTSQD